MRRHSDITGVRTSENYWEQFRQPTWMRDAGYSTEEEFTPFTLCFDDPRRQ